MRSVFKVDHERAGKIAREARAKANMRLTEISKKLGVSTAFYHYLECGKRNWSNERYQKAMEVIALEARGK